MLKHLDDRRVCPHCQRETNERPYLMARVSDELVMDPRLALWLVVIVMVLLLIVT